MVRLCAIRNFTSTVVSRKLEESTGNTSELAALLCRMAPPPGSGNPARRRRQVVVLTLYPFGLGLRV